MGQFFGCMTDPNPSPPNSSTEDKPQTDRKTAGIANHAGETFFHGVKHLKMKKPTFIQQIIHGGSKLVDPIKAKIIADSNFIPSDPSTSRSDPLSTFNTDASIAVGLMNGNHQVDQNSELNEAGTLVDGILHIRVNYLISALKILALCIPEKNTRLLKLRYVPHSKSTTKNF